MADIVTVTPDTEEEKIVDGVSNDDETLLAGKYKTQEELEAGYLELQKKLGTTDTDEPTNDTDEPTEDVKAKEIVENAGLDFDALSEEYATNGKLTDESRKALVDSGIPEPLVDNYIAGQVAIAEKQQVAMVNTVGGQKSYDSMIEWAGKNLDSSSIEAYNKAINGTSAEATLAIQGLNMQYKTSNPKLINGSSSTGNVQGYQSNAQLTKDMGNPLYKTDPAFRKTVQDKLAVSKIL